jgi:hypothetical protein
MPRDYYVIKMLKSKLQQTSFLADLGYKGFGVPLTVEHWELPNTRVIDHERTVYENLNCPTFSNLLCEQLTDLLRQFFSKNHCKHDLQTQNWLIGLYRCAKI